jgi:hypothetical protein
VLSIAISTSWTQPILTLLLYVVLEIFTNNVVKPVLLGGSTGLSPLAVIVSALFWTWIWGPVGLLLATPIAACLVVLGRYFPRFLSYSVILAADPPPSPEKRFLHLLEQNRFSEAKALIQGFAGSQLSILPWNMPASQKISQLKALSSEHILLSATDPESTAEVGKMVALPNAVVLVGLWNLPDKGSAELMTQIHNIPVRAVYTNVKEAIEGIVSQLAAGEENDISHKKPDSVRTF